MPLIQRTLEDLIRGLRANKKNESVFIGQAIQEIKEEIANPDEQKQSVAIAKLSYMQMLGVDMSWAAFHVIKVMSQTKFTSKRVGYQAASQSFHDGTDVIILATNLIRKDMTSPNVWEAGIALNCLSNICTTDLARDLAADIVTLLTSSKQYVRKKAALVLYKIFLKFPDALRPSFPRLKEKLDDTDQGVVSASVNVICELARRNPANYINLAPILFKILTATDRPANNWVLIKIVKLFAALLPAEERLAKKLVGPLTNLMNTTTAMSLQYECIQTCTIGLSDHLPTIKLCIQKLRTFVEDPDQNLKYLGLLALNNIMKIHPKAVAEHRDLVLNCLEDADTSIRLRALDLLEGMVNKKNIADIVRKLLDSIEKADNAQYKDALVEKVVNICSKNSYQSITDFEWYISVLMELAHVTGTQHGVLIANQFMDVIIRVNIVRPFGIKNMISLLRDTQILSDNLREGGNCEVLYSAAWVVGEFATFVDNILSVIESLLQPRVVHLPPHIQSVYMQSVLKLFATAIGGSKQPHEEGMEESSSSPNEKLDEIKNVMKARLPLFTQSQHLEVQERACFVLEILNLCNDMDLNGSQIGAEVASLFDEPLNPVAKATQKKAQSQIPEGLDLDKWINEPEEEVEESSEKPEWDKVFDFIKSESESDDSRKSSTSESKGKESGPSKKVQRSGIYYLSAEPTQRRYSIDEEVPPSQKITAKDLGMEGSSSSNISYKDKLKAKPKKATKKNMGPVSILKDEDIDGDFDEKKESASAESAISELDKVDLRSPLRADERLPTPTHRVAKAAPAAKEEKKKKRKTEGEGKTKKTKKGSTKATKSTPGKSGKQLIDLGSFDPIPSPTAEPKIDTYSEVGSPSVEPVEEKKKTKKEGTKKTKGGEKKKGTGKKTSKKEAEQVPASPAAPRASAKYKPLCQDENLSVIYELRVSPKDGKKIMAAFAFKNLSKKTITNIQFSVPATLNMKISNESAANVNVTMQAGETAQHNVIFDCNSIQQVQRLPGSLSYTADDAPFKKDFSIYIPCSAFILPVKLEKEQFFAALTSPTTKWVANSLDVKLETDISSFIVSLAVLLHVELIMQEGGISFYGRTVQGHEVAVYAKQKSEDAIHIDLKCTDDQISKNLITEVSNVFTKL